MYKLIDTNISTNITTNKMVINRGMFSYKGTTNSVIKF